MSFVYAKKFNDSIIIFSDTKATMDSVNYENNNEENNIRKYGILKCYIIAPYCAIAFAGEIKNANTLLGQLSGKTSIEEIKQLCYQAHLDCKQDTDFILVYYQSQETCLLSIKNGPISSANSEWIGSITAFNEFQKRSEKNEPLNDYEVKVINSDPFACAETMHEYENFFDRFYSAIFSCSDSSVVNPSTSI